MPAGGRSGVYVTYRWAKVIVQLKVALSYCSVEQARLNLRKNARLGFRRRAARGGDAWDRWLGRIEVQGGTDARTTKFYTDLYHALLGRRTVSDVDGSYRDMTGGAGRAPDPNGRRRPPRYVHHNSDAFWGAQWTLNVLWPLAYPENARYFAIP